MQGHFHGLGWGTLSEFPWWGWAKPGYSVRIVGCAANIETGKLLNTSRKSDEGKEKFVAQLNVRFEHLPEETYGNNDK